MRKTKLPKINKTKQHLLQANVWQFKKTKEKASA
jgi:hypothetical protein